MTLLDFISVIMLKILKNQSISMKSFIEIGADIAVEDKHNSQTDRVSLEFIILLLNMDCLKSVTYIEIIDIGI